MLLLYTTSIIYNMYNIGINCLIISIILCNKISILIFIPHIERLY